MVHDVMPNVPQTVRPKRAQKGNAAKPFVQCAVRRAALLASVMTDDEGALNHEPGCNPAAELQRPMREKHCARQRREQQHVVEHQQHDRMQRDALRQRNQP